MTKNEYLKNTIYLCLTIIPFLAWYVADSLFFPFITGKNFVFRVLTEIMFFSYVLLALKDASYRIRGSAVLYAYGAFITVLALADAFGVNPAQSFWSNFERMEGFVTHAHLFLYFIVLYAFIKTEKAWNYVLGLFMVANVAVVSQGYLQMFAQKDFWPNGLIARQGFASFVQFLNAFYPTSMGNGLRLDSTLGNAAYYGIYTVFNLFLAAVLATQSKIKGSKGGLIMLGVLASALVILVGEAFGRIGNSVSGNGFLLASGVMNLLGIICLMWAGYTFAKKWESFEIGKGVFITIAVANFIQLIYTFTRGSWIGFMGGLLVILISYLGLSLYKKLKVKYPNWSDNKLRLINFSSIVLLSVFILFVSLSALNKLTEYKTSDFVKNNAALARLATIDLSSPSKIHATLTNKNANYEEVLAVTGEGTIASRIMNAYISTRGWLDRPILGYGQDNYPFVFSKYADPRMYKQETWFDRSHDVFFDWLVAGGIFGLLTYLALYLTSIWMLWFARGRTNISFIERAMLSALLVAYFIHNIFVFDMLISYILFFTVLAYIAARTRGAEKEILLEEKEAKKAKYYHDYESAVTVAMSVVLLVTLYYVNFEPWNTNVLLLRTLQPAGSTDAERIENTYIASKAAIESSLLGRHEAREQLVQKVVDYISQDYSKLKPEERTAVNTALEKLANYGIQEGANLIGPDNAVNVRGSIIYGELLIRLQKYDDALAVLKRGYESAPNKQTMAFSYVQALLAKGGDANLNMAYRIALKAYTDDSGYDDAYKVLAQVVLKSGYFTQFITDMKKTYGQLPINDISFAILVQGGQFDEAMSLADYASTKDPANAAKYKSYKDEALRLKTALKTTKK